ncbi:MAG: hybrid sensor histidine kinase/response regulator, partial [Bdellovibrio sp.]
MKRIVHIPKGWWTSLSVSHKLYAVVGIMALLIATELFTLLFAMNTLSAVRALVAGEGTWSKAQKDAVHELLSYAVTGDEKHYFAMQEHLQIPLGDHNARMGMPRAGENPEPVIQGFLQGKLHRDDIMPVIGLLRRFHNVDYIERAITEWVRADEWIFRLINTAAELHGVIAASGQDGDRDKVQSLLLKISGINDRLTEIENRFSYILGEASRWLEQLLMVTLITLVATVESTGLMLTFFLSRALKRSLNELHDFANRVGDGDLNRVLPVRSRDELGMLAEALNKMATNLKETVSERRLAERSNEIKNLFLANMSHEIRTPLNSILGFADLLKDPAVTEVERRNYLNIIERTGANVAAIINDILDISKVEAGKLEIEKSVCPLDQILSDLESIMALRCQEKGIYLQIEGKDLPQSITTDATRFKQILLNIVGNAVKFTEKGGVSVKFETQDQRLICTVKDTGLGIESKSMDKLFQPFSQLDLSTSKKYGGTGLGLTLSRRLAQFLGGDVVLENSEPGKGSTFVISIALEEPQQSPARSQPTLPKDAKILSGKRILLVEDSADNQILARQYLSRAGAEVDVVNHGLEAIERAKKVKYDLVLMDIQMPVMDGYTATQHLRRMGVLTPIIALTAHAMKEDLQKCLNAGCNSYLSKPYRRDGLIAI